MAAIVAGGAVLAWTPGESMRLTQGAALVAGACVCWALDNNFTRKVSLRDPLVIAATKGAVAGSVNLALALSFGADVPDVRTTVSALALGFAGYGVSLALFVLALRHLGTARAGAYYAIAPFFGALYAITVQHEPFTFAVGLAGVLMALGVWLHVSERHRHRHVHEMLRHTHAHRHDAHHQHTHEADLDGTEPHIHDHAGAGDTWVLYPGQNRDVPLRCWSWFVALDQMRGQGEPAVLVALTRFIVAEHDISPRHIYAAGLSAGAAMAVVLGQTYPDVYAAVGSHSGLPYAVAADVYSALDVMPLDCRLRATWRGIDAIPDVTGHGPRSIARVPRHDDVGRTER